MADPLDAMSEKTRQAANAMIGKRVQLCGDHPWAGYDGVIAAWGNTPFGLCPIVQLDDVPGQRCFITDPKQFRYIELRPARGAQVRIVGKLDDVLHGKASHARR